MKEINSLKLFGKILVVLGAVLIILVVFQTGVVVGSHRSDFSAKWNMMYYGMRDPRPFFEPFVDDRNPNGIVGEVISAKFPALIVRDRNGDREQTVFISTSTIMKALGSAGTSSDIKIGTRLIVIGEPGPNGEITAKLVRLLPPMPLTPPSGSSTLR